MPRHSLKDIKALQARTQIVSSMVPAQGAHFSGQGGGGLPAPENKKGGVQNRGSRVCHPFCHCTPFEERRGVLNPLICMCLGSQLCLGSHGGGWVGLGGFRTAVSTTSVLESSLIQMVPTQNAARHWQCLPPSIVVHLLGTCICMEWHGIVVLRILSWGTFIRAYAQTRDAFTILWICVHKCSIQVYLSACCGSGDLPQSHTSDLERYLHVFGSRVPPGPASPRWGGGRGIWATRLTRVVTL